MNQTFLFLFGTATGLAVLLTIMYRRKYLEAMSQLFVDPLTGVCSRIGFMQIAQKVYSAHLRPPGATMHLAYLDLDKFKLVNDENDHSFGDQALKLFGKILLTHVRGGDVVARLGGDEFVILFAHPMGLQNFDITANMTSIREDFEAEMSALYADIGKVKPEGVSVSYGIVEHNVTEGTSLETLMAAADKKLVARKRKREN